VTMTVLT